jgi:streptomycin 6-kinase
MSKCVAVNMVTPAVRNKAYAVGADQWLKELPDLVAHLEREWSITLGLPYEDATEAFVARATLAGDIPVVLKVIIPRSNEAAKNEITALRMADGRGCVSLIRDDVDSGALLLERLGRPLCQLGVPIRDRHEILCTLAAQIWRPAPDCGLPTGAEKARWLSGFITTTWEELDRPCSEEAVAYALNCATRRIDAHENGRAVLVHGDVHQWNTLENGSGFKLVDPDGLLAEPEYDMGIIMREDPLELMVPDPQERARWLAERTHLDVTAIWEWGVIERVSTGLLCTKIGLQPVGSEMLRASDWVAHSP